MASENRQNLFITLEGIEGVGKTTVQQYIAHYIAHKTKQPVIQTREPGGTPLAEKIRDLALKHSAEPVFPTTELLLMFAARAQHINEVILPALAQGAYVVCDRFVDASYAYQGGGRGLDMKQIEMLEKVTCGDLKPDKVIILDAPVEVGLARAKNRNEFDRFESEKVAFFEKVRAVYLARAKADPTRYTIIDASGHLQQVHAQLEALLHTLITVEQPL